MLVFPEEVTKKSIFKLENFAAAQFVNCLVQRFHHCRYDDNI